MTWEDVVPFPGNPVYAGRLAQMRKEWGGYDHDIVGSPAIFDNSTLAFPELAPDALIVGDGNHRRELAREDGKLDSEFIADLYRGLTRAEMHRRRRGLNDRRTVKPAERFLELVEEGDREKSAIKDAVEGCGWQITHERARHGLSCTNELEWIWKRDKGALVRAIETYEAAFGTNSGSTQAKVLKGLGAFWIKHPDADADRLVKSIKAVKPKSDYQRVDAIYSAGKNQASEVTFIKGVYDGIRYVLVMGYNRNQRKGRLPVS